MSSTSKPARNGTFVILLVGETGSGKSTLVNYITNYFANATVANPRIAIRNRFYPQSTESSSDSEQHLHDDLMGSGTAKCANYDFQTKDRRFCFIDSPGVSDTAGSEKDDEHINGILEAAKNAGTLSGMIVVISGASSRLTATFRNSLSRLRGILPDALVDNLVVALTNCSPASYNFRFASLHPWKLKAENIFFMNNSAFSRYPQEWQNNKQKRADIEYEWTKSMQEIDDMVARITELDAKSTKLFADMQERRTRIQVEVNGIVLELDKLQKTKEAMEAAQREYSGATDEVKQKSNYKKNTEVEYDELVPR